MMSESEEFPTRVDRNVYPRPEYRYPSARISTTYADSVADFPHPLAAPEEAPDVLLVIPPFGAENADAPTQRFTQYFEMFGNRALYHDE